MYRDWTLDARDSLLGRRDELTPPRRLVFIGNSQEEFRALGDRWVATFADVGGLQPTDRVLDVGCGVGRMAVPLTQYLQSTGSYEGIDIVREGIDWCRDHITPRFPNFRFQHADVYNKEYNPGGRFAAAEYRFPFLDDQFDFVFLTSVFTHMMPPDVENYVREIARVLRPGGRCLITFFLLNERSLAQLKRADVQQGRQFRFEIDGCLTIDRITPEVGIAYREEVVRDMYARHGLRVSAAHYGAWCRTVGAQHGQDILVAVNGKSVTSIEWQ